ncbi:MAG: ankyrin repeat domain-containing protein [Bacteroidetes bacterium]|nr:ankyrin repeat domain-containing protein [Bacteroidota bacterium]
MDEFVFGNNSAPNLHMAAKFNFIKTAKMLMAAGADLNLIDHHQASPLHFAAAFGSIEVGRLLIQAGANIDAHDAKGMTPLEVALAQGHSDFAKMLSERTELNLSPQNGDLSIALFMKAVSDGNTEYVCDLLTKGVNPNTALESGVTALMIAAENGYADIVQALLEMGAVVNAKRFDIGATALHFAGQNGHYDVVEDLLKNGADVNAKMNDGKTALMAAALDGHTEIVNQLLDHGAIINERKNDGTTPLILAAMEGHAETVRVLVARGADLYSQVINGTASYTPIMFAEIHHHSQVVEILRQAIASDMDDICKISS